MTYIVYKRFHAQGLGGKFNLPYGTKCHEEGGWLYAPDGRKICAVTSENGWCHFRPDTEEGAYRQALLEKLYAYYSSKGSKPAKGDPADFAPKKWPDAQNYYWKNLLRTMPTDKLEAFYESRIGKQR